MHTHIHRRTHTHKPYVIYALLIPSPPTLPQLVGTLPPSHLMTVAGLPSTWCLSSLPDPLPLPSLPSPSGGYGNKLSLPLVFTVALQYFIHYWSPGQIRQLRCKEQDAKKYSLNVNAWTAHATAIGKVVVSVISAWNSWLDETCILMAKKVQDSSHVAYPCSVNAYTRMTPTSSALQSPQKWVLQGEVTNTLSCMFFNH